MQAEFRRVFFALWPSPEVARRLHRLGEGARGQALLAEDLHLTLAFIGDVDAARLERLQRIAAGLRLPRTRLSFQWLNYWAHNHILWASPEAWPPELAGFVAELRGALMDAGFKLEARDFVPHVTLLRKAAEPAEMFAGAVDWTVDAWSLAASADTGRARYRRLAGWSAV